jgi:hypothetical protein
LGLSQKPENRAAFSREIHKAGHVNFCAKNQYFVSKEISNVRQRNLTSYIKTRGRISLIRIFKEISGLAASIEKQRRSQLRFYFFDAALFKTPHYNSFLEKNQLIHFGHKCVFLTLMAKMKKQILP